MNIYHPPSRSRRDRQALERRRLEAAKLFAKETPDAEIARLLKVTPAAVCQWYAEWEKKGVDGLRSKGKPGAKPKLTEAKLAKIERALEKGPRAHGYSTDLWTLARIRKLVGEVGGVSYGITHTWRIMTLALGWSAQKPETRARERNEDAIRRWKRYTWPQIKKKRRRWVPV